jgi:hypothetical protein
VDIWLHHSKIHHSVFLFSGLKSKAASWHSHRADQQASRPRKITTVSEASAQAGQNVSPQIFTTELFLMTASNQDDRRNEKRWEVCLDAVWEGESGRYTARITDLSEGGCYIDTLSQASAGEVVNFKLRLPGDEWLFLKGEVAHLTPPLGFGVRFIELTESDLTKLRSLMNDLERPHNPVTTILSS